MATEQMTYFQAADHVKTFINAFHGLQYLADMLEKAAGAEAVIAESTTRLQHVRNLVAEAEGSVEAAQADAAQKCADIEAKLAAKTTEHQASLVAIDDMKDALVTEIEDLVTKRDRLQAAVDSLRSSAAALAASV